eukprot:842751-Prorocentrum_lima.AAC.1
MKPISRITQSFGVDVASLVDGLGQTHLYVLHVLKALQKESATNSMCAGDVTKTKRLAGLDNLGP